MKHTSWVVAALLLSMGGSAIAADADGQPGPTPSIGTAKAPIPVAGAADDSHKQALLDLHQERQAFAESFDWNQPGDRQALRRQYADAMDRFSLRELELKRDWYRATGQTELLACTEAALEARRNPLRAVVPPSGERNPGAKEPQEVTR